MPRPASSVQFGTFEVDLRAGELRKDGLKIKLQGQPIQVLTTLLEHPGEVVTREELRQRLWPTDTFVDFEHNLNSAVKRLREALGDSADNPRFVETLPRHGYRFIAPAAELGQATQGARVRAQALWVLGLSVLAIAVLVVGIKEGGWGHLLLRGADTGRIQSLAVLPLENLSGKPEEEYFADGMTEEVITELGGIHALRVISRQSVMHYKGTDKPLLQIASELHVEALVQGSALRAGNRVRITVQLVRATPEEHLWAQSYERDLSDVIGLQAEVARDIASQIRVTLTPEEQGQLARASPVSIEAYDDYLQGRYSSHWNRKQDVDKAINYFEQAAKLDPGYALAWASLAEARSFRATHYGPLEGFKMARGAAERALALNPNLAEAHVVMGWIKREYDWDWAGSDASLQRALAIAPGSAAANREAARLAGTLGRFEQALALDRRALELDPLNGLAYMTLVMHLQYAGQRDDAAAAIKKALGLNLDVPVLHLLLGRVYLAQSRPQDALAEMEKETDLGYRLQGLALAYHALARKKESDAALAQVIAKIQTDGAFQIAEVYAFRGEADRAFEWLDRAYSQHDSGFTIMKGDPLLKNLEPDPRYAALLKKMRLPA